jgi:hypothetical protein
LSEQRDILDVLGTETRGQSVERRDALFTKQFLPGFQ